MSQKPDWYFQSNLPNRSVRKSMNTDGETEKVTLAQNLYAERYSLMFVAQ